MVNVRSILRIAPSTNRPRIYTLDYIRGILILLVLYHHSNGPLGNYVLQFHMPALFLLSGYTEYLLNKEPPFTEYVKSKFIRLIVPYFAFEALNLLLYILLQLITGNLSLSLADAFVSIITCVNNSYLGLYGRLWFLPAIFVSSIISYGIRIFLAKNKPIYILVYCLPLVALSYITCTFLHFRLPFTIDTAFLGSTFLLIGFALGRSIEWWLASKNRLCDLFLFTLFSLIFVLCNRYSNPVCYMYINAYSDFPFMIVCAISGSFIVFILSKMLFPLLQSLSFLRNITTWYSINSLATFPIHLTIKIFFIPILSYVGTNTWYCLFACMFILNIPIVNIISDYFPFMIGKIKKQATNRPRKNKYSLY